MKKDKKPLVLGILLSLLFILSFIESPLIWSIKGNIVNFLEAPLKISKNLFDTLSELTQFRRLIEESNRLKNQMTQFKYKISQLEYLRLENKELRSLLSLKGEMEHKLIPTRVISRDLTNWMGPVIINKGSQDGIRENFLVISDNGLVGAVLQVENNISKVILSIDPTFRIGAKITRNGAIGLLAGWGIPKIYKMKYISLEKKIEIGDEVITAGLSDIFPGGIVIGKIIKFGIQRGGFYQYALVKPSVDFSNLNYIACVIPG